MKTSLFITCITDLMYADVGKSVVRVLERNGVEFDFSEGQTCCGQPAFSSGSYKFSQFIVEYGIEF